MINIRKLAEQAGGNTVVVGIPDGPMTCFLFSVESNALQRFADLVLEEAAHMCSGIAAGYTGKSRKLEGAKAAHAAGQRDGANECASTIRALKSGA